MNFLCHDLCYNHLLISLTSSQIRRHAKKDVGMQLKYLEDMAFVHPSRIVDMDGIHYNPKDYLERYGWTSMGQEAYALQLIIRGNVPLEI